jgi:hypothetical protein
MSKIQTVGALMEVARRQRRAISGAGIGSIAGQLYSTGDPSWNSFEAMEPPSPYFSGINQVYRNREAVRRKAEREG